jgi:PAS domain S-box-containing protein
MRSGASKIVAIYVLSGSLWVSVSDVLFLAIEGPHDHPILIMGSVSAMMFLVTTAIILLKFIDYHYKKLEESEQQYRSYFEDNPTPMWIYNRRSLKFVTVNNAALDNYGYSRDEFEQMTIMDIRPVSEGDKVIKAIDNFASVYKNLGNWIHLKKDGSEIFVHITSHRILTGDKDNVMVMAKDITLRLQTEKQITEANAQLKSVNEVLLAQKSILTEIQRISRLGGWTYYLSTKKLERSEGIYEILDYTSLEDADPVYDLIKHLHPDDKDKFLRQVQNLTVRYLPMDIIYRIINDAGKVKYIRQIAQMEFRDSKPYRINGSMQDITEIKQMEQERNEFLLKLEDTLENMSDAFFTIDRQWNIRSVNAMFSKVTGLSKEALLHQSFLKIWPHTRDSLYLENFNKAFFENQTTKFEEYSQVFNKWLRLTCYPTREGAAVFFSDVTVTKEKDIQLKQALERYDMVAMATQDILYDFDLVHNKLSYSNNFNNLNKQPLSSADSPSRTWMRLIHPNDVRRVIGASAHVLKSGQNKYECEYRVDFGNHEYRYVQDNAFIVFDENKQPVRMIGAIRDINDLKAKEASLIKTNNTLVEIAWVESHEFRRPLASILGLLDLLNSSNDEEEKEEFIQYIDISARELDGIIHKVNTLISEITDQSCMV